MKAMMTVLVLVGGALLAGCSKENKEEPAKATTTGAASGSGIQECDDYFKRAEECFSKNPAMKAQTEGALKGMKDMIQAKSSTPGGKDEMKAQCKQHMDLLVQSCK